MGDLFPPAPETLEFYSSSLFLERFSRLSAGRPPQKPPSLKLLSEGSRLPPFPSNFPNSNRIPGTQFVVDGFRHSGAFSVSYFLSHFHADHYAGLSPNWSRGLVFCSPITARLCVTCLNVPECFVVPIDLGRSICIDGCEVTFVDANHCPGAVQILVRVRGAGESEERYVHTGDMRFSDSMLNDRLLSGFIGADAVFLDTTYCNPRFVFPSQDESIEYVVKIIERTRNSVSKDSDAEGKRNSVLFVVSTYVVGKEKLLLEIARRTGRPVLVDTRKLSILNELGLGGSGQFTTDASQSDVHVVRWNELGETWPYFRPNLSNMKKILERKEYSRVVGFVPTGWVFSGKRDDFLVRVKDSCEIHLVPYSEHSSYDELRQYVKFLRPKRVVPTVGMENGKKSNDEYRLGICKHFTGLMDEMSNKLSFLEAFRPKISSGGETQKPEAGLENENCVVGLSFTSRDDQKDIQENQRSVADSAHCGLQQDSSLDNTTMQSLLNVDSRKVLDVSGQDGQFHSEDELVVSGSVDDEMDVETSMQELQDCLPAWVTTRQMTNLLKDSGGDIAEAVSLFYECERELHEQVVAQGKTSSTLTPDTKPVGASLKELVSASDSCLTLGPTVPTCRTSDQMAEMFPERSLSQPTKSPLPKFAGFKKRRTLGMNSSKKRAKSSENSKPDKFKQVSITKFFDKAQGAVPPDDGMGSTVSVNQVQDQHVHHGASTDGTKLSQLLVISVDHAATLLEKAKNDINLAVDLFYSESSGLGQEADKKVNSYNTFHKSQTSPIDFSPTKRNTCQEKVIYFPTLSGQGDKEPDKSGKFVSLPPEVYVPTEHACWTTGQPAPFLHLARTFELVEQERGRLRVTAMLCNMFRSLLALSPEDVLPAVYLCTNRIAPDYENVELNIGSSLVASAIKETFGTKRSRIREMYNALGDLGDVAQTCRLTQSLLVVPQPLYIHELFSVLHRISIEAGSGSTSRKKRLIVNLMRSCREKEIKFLVRILVRNMRIGATMRTVLPALAQAVVMNLLPDSSKEYLKTQLESISLAVVEAYNMLPNLDMLVPSLMSKGIQFSSLTLSMVPGIPIRPMLAKVANGISQALKQFQGKAFSCEYKYDGQRAQIHKLTDGSVRVFSRNGEETTSRFPDVVKIIKESSKPTAETFILDAEVVAIDRKSGSNLLPFQQLCSRERGGRDSSVKLDNIKVDVCAFVFDIVFANGERLLEFPLRQRRRYLKDLFHDAKIGYFEFVQEMTIKADEACIESQETLARINSFLEDAFKHSCEGIVVKSLDTDAEYAASKRTDTWLKVKKDYINGLGDSFDLVPIGAWHGNGRKAGWFSPFLMACYSADSEEFQSVCRVMSGFSDSFYVEMKEFFSDEKILCKKPSYYHTLEVPDMWFSPELVWEIRGADLTLSPVHQAAVGLVHPSRGISIRFPRFIRTVVDRTPEDCTTASDVADAFNLQTRKVDVNIEN